jgi:hypothetical protein
MPTFEDIINQSFIEEQNKYNNRQIDNSEEKNVDTLFKEINTINTDCNICYSEDNCIQCYQCHFRYCKNCLIKVISEFKKCSACNIDFKNNYQSLKNKNKKITTTTTTTTTTSTSTSTKKSSTQYFDENIENYLLNEDIIEDDILINQIIIDNIISNRNMASTNASTRQKDNYLKELLNNEILPFDLKTFKTDTKYNFKVNYDRKNHLQIYTSTKNSLSPIILNYKILDTYFQSTLRVYLIHILDYPNKFKEIWAQISILINNFCNNYLNTDIKNNYEFEVHKKNLIEEINELCLKIS